MDKRQAFESAGPQQHALARAALSGLKVEVNALAQRRCQILTVLTAIDSELQDRLVAHAHGGDRGCVRRLDYLRDCSSVGSCVCWTLRGWCGILRRRRGRLLLPPSRLQLLE